MSHERSVALGPVHTVLFDLDGTMVDSEPGIAASLRYAFELEGYPVPDDDTLRTAIGPPFEIGLPALGVHDADVARVTRRYRERYEDSGLFEASVYPGIREALAAFAAAGLRLGVATAKPEPTARRIVEHFDLASAFDVVAGATYEPGRRTKAEVIAHALDRFGLDATPLVLMVGDRDHDVHGAQVHGIPVAGVTWGYGSVAELLGAGADHLVDHPDELVGLVATARTTIGVGDTAAG
jgi:phosphoglycolate phosphatase